MQPRIITEPQSRGLTVFYVLLIS